VVSAGLITVWPAAGHGAALAVRSPAAVARPASPVMTYAVPFGGTAAVGQPGHHRRALRERPGTGAIRVRARLR
jgi:hypothetical protein